MLTPREREVVIQIAYGYTNAQIAEQLAISIRTVEMHRSSAMRKLHAQSRAEVVRWALDEALLH